MRPHPKHEVIQEEFVTRDTVNEPITITKSKPRSLLSILTYHPTITGKQKTDKPIPSINTCYLTLYCPIHDTHNSMKNYETYKKARTKQLTDIRKSN